MRIEDIPNDVMWVSFMKMSQTAVGIETYRKVQDIIEKYPEWFPQEHIYNSIPEAVKILFEKEKSELHNTFFPRVAMDIIPGEGMMGYMDRVNEINMSLPVKTVQESLNYIFEEHPKKEKAYREALLKLHNKHYKKYKYKFE